MRTIDKLLGMPIITLEEGTRLGKLKGVEVDYGTGQLAYLRYDAEGSRADGLIPWEAVRSIGADAITVLSKGAAQESISAADREHLTPFVGDRPVVTVSGERLGNINNYDVDELTGRVESYHVAVGGLFGRITGNEIVFPHSAIRTFGKDAIIVSDSVATHKKGHHGKT